MTIVWATPYSPPARVGNQVQTCTSSWLLTCKFHMELGFLRVIQEMQRQCLWMRTKTLCLQWVQQSGFITQISCPQLLSNQINVTHLQILPLAGGIQLHSYCTSWWTRSWLSKILSEGKLCFCPWPPLFVSSLRWALLQEPWGVFICSKISGSLPSTLCLIPFKPMSSLDFSVHFVKLCCLCCVFICEIMWNSTVVGNLCSLVHDQRFLG